MISVGKIKFCIAAIKFLSLPILQKLVCVFSVLLLPDSGWKLWPDTAINLWACAKKDAAFLCKVVSFLLTTVSFFAYSCL